VACAVRGCGGRLALFRRMYMKRFLYPIVRLAAMALNVALLVVAIVNNRDTIAHSILHPLAYAGLVLCHPLEITYVLAFWAPTFALLALSWSK
jgi:hypothetical protein